MTAVAGRTVAIRWPAGASFAAGVLFGALAVHALSDATVAQADTPLLLRSACPDQLTVSLLATATAEPTRLTMREPGVYRAALNASGYDMIEGPRGAALPLAELPLGGQRELLVPDAWCPVTSARGGFGPGLLTP